MGLGVREWWSKPWIMMRRRFLGLSSRSGSSPGCEGRARKRERLEGEGNSRGGRGVPTAREGSEDTSEISICSQVGARLRIRDRGVRMGLGQMRGERAGGHYPSPSKPSGI